MNANSKFCSKFKPSQVKEMKELAAKGYAIAYIARLFNCCQNAVSNRVFMDIPPKAISLRKQKLFMRYSNLTVKQVQAIRKAGLEGVSSVELSKKYNISQTTALGIIRGKTFRWLPGKTKSGEIIPIEYTASIISDKRRGAKKKSKKLVKSGVLIKYAKKYDVDTSTICRWIRKGKLKVKKSELLT